MYKRNLIEIRPDSKEALFEHLETGEQEVFTYDLLHVTPPMKAPSCIKESALADAGGWVDVDPYTLQHKKFANVFGIGDCSNLPTSKTGAAIRKQAPVVVRNLMSLIKGSSLDAKYDGYTSCPLVTGYNKLVLADTMTMDLLGLQKEELIDGLDYAGVAAYLGDANEAKVNLFI